MFQGFYEFALDDFGWDGIIETEIILLKFQDKLLITG